MANFDPTYTHRIRMEMQTPSGNHRMQFRPNLAVLNNFQDAADTLADLFSPFYPPDCTFMNAQAALQGDDVFYDVPFTPKPGTSSGSTNPQWPVGRYYNFVSTTNGGGRTAVWLFDGDYRNFSRDSRLTGAEEAIVATTVNTLNAGGRMLLTSGRTPATFRYYANVGVNRALAQRARRG